MSLVQLHDRRIQGQPVRGEVCWYWDSLGAIWEPEKDLGGPWAVVGVYKDHLHTCLSNTGQGIPGFGQRGKQDDEESLHILAQTHCAWHGSS